MDSSQHYKYNEYNEYNESSDGSYSDSDEENHLKPYKKNDIEKRFQINEGMMYLTSCNINPDIIPLTLHGKISENKCICYVGGSKDSPGTLVLNNLYDVYCDFFIHTHTHPTYSIGNVMIINIEELNCNNFNNLSFTKVDDGITQCPSKLLIPIISTHSVGIDNTNYINTDTIYITSILPTKIKQLTLTFDILDINGPSDPPSGGKFILKLILKKTDNAKNSFLEEKYKQNINKI
jgi:hypothetical protein